MFNNAVNNSQNSRYTFTLGSLMQDSEKEELECSITLFDNEIAVHELSAIATKNNIVDFEKNVQILGTQLVSRMSTSNNTSKVRLPEKVFF